MAFNCEPRDLAMVVRTENRVVYGKLLGLPVQLSDRFEDTPRGRYWLLDEIIPVEISCQCGKCLRIIVDVDALPDRILKPIRKGGGMDEAHRRWLERVNDGTATDDRARRVVGAPAPAEPNTSAQETGRRPYGLDRDPAAAGPAGGFLGLWLDGFVNSPSTRRRVKRFGA